VFAHNRVSSALVKEGGRTVAELQKAPEHRYDNSGTASFVGHATDEALKSSAFVLDFLNKSEDDKSRCPFNMAFNTDLSLWDWFEQPGNDWRLRRFTALLIRDGKLFKDSTFTEAINWNELTPKDVVVDVGGNLGTVTQTLAHAFDKPQFVVQDKEKVIPGAEKFWQATFPSALQEGRVRLKVHDFFDPQPVAGAAVYFMRLVLHDWADSECIKILNNIRKAAAAHSKLVLFEFWVPYACEDTLNPPAVGNSKPLPSPLVPNIDTGVYKTMVDLQMLNVAGGQERTLGAFIELGKASGWKFEYVKHELLSSYVFSPA